MFMWELHFHYLVVELDILNNLKRLGREFVSTIDRIIDNLDDILEGESSESE